jgi:beta-lactamase class D
MKGRGEAARGARRRCKFFITLFVSLFSVPAVAEDQALAKLFAQRGIDGTIVISSLHSKRTFIHNDPRANHRFPPASTFKILNTLISLEEKAISEKDAVLKWDGRTYDFPDWNRDHTLESAFKVSCVMCGSLRRTLKSVTKKTCPCARS